MKEYVRTIDGLPLIIKVILALPFIDGIIYGIYRIAKGRLIIGILWIIFGACILWLVDLISILLKGKVVFLV
ncbi:MAG TPA: hypothetical protein PLH02_01535 [Bacillota bacterium]|nr:hypothetical protein [Bacillota bacterium]HPF42101.1 hypothetical protein [Bacillota bacterium]HPJ85823.1 hypothetical protein [Bacillota bacterium]HPQ61548.1 hypothetical protein [Bacillota bacterium]HRX91360.1 hypothetical protein [Candidatus Izemoplasmatales bacterium]